MSEGAPASPEQAILPQSPYIGLTPYSEENAAFFFGRESERDLIVANLIASRLTLLFAESGVGKSSLLRAGVAAYLREFAEETRAERGTPEFVIVVFSSWRDDALGDLISAVLAAAAPYFNGRPLELGEGERSLTRAIEAVSERLDANVLVILDQFEDYFLYHPSAEGEGTFFEELARAVNRIELRASFLISVREDALALLDRFKGRIADLFENRLRIEHLDREAAREAIVKPIEQYNRLLPRQEQPVAIEPELVEAVLDEVRTGKVVLGQAGSGAVDGGLKAGEGEERIETPFLQLVMSRLWNEEMKGGSRTLRLETLERLGGAERIVRTHLDQAMESLTPTEQDAAATIFRQLVTPSGTKIAHTLGDLADYAHLPESALAPVLGELSSGEIRILRPVAPPPGREDGGRYEIFHDVLAPAILDWRARHDAARAREQAERELAESREQARRERRRARIFRTVAVIAVALAVIAIALGVLAWHQKQIAEEQKRTVRSQALAAEAQAELAIDPQESLRLAADAAGTAHTAEARQALRAALGQSLVRATLRHGKGVNEAVFSPDGKRVVTASDDHTARVWDALSGKTLALLRGHTGAINDVSFSPDGKRVVTASDDHTARVWDADSGKTITVLGGHEDQVNAVAFSLDGKRIVTASDDRTARVWDADSGKTITVLGGHEDWVNAVAFSRDGKRIVTASADGTARVWEAGSGRTLVVLRHADAVNDAAFSSDGKRVVTASSDWTARVWDVNDRSPPKVLAHEGEVFAAAFSRDGKRVVTASDDGAARVWDAGSGERLAVLLGHKGTVWEASFNPAGTRVVTASDDGTARVWDALPAEGPVVVKKQGWWVEDVAFSPDARLVVTSGGTIVGTTERGVSRVRDSGSGKRLADFRGHKRTVSEASFNAAGTRVVTASDDGKARVWDVRDDGSPPEILRSRGRVVAAAFSPDGKRVVTASVDAGLLRIREFTRGTARSWDARSGDVLVRLRWHSPQANCDASGSDVVRNVVAFSPDRERVAAADSNDCMARVLDARHGKTIVVLRGHTDAINDVSFSGNGKRIVTASSDRTARVWDADSGQTVVRLRAHTGRVTAASFSRDGAVIVTAGEDKTVRLWDAKRPVVFAVLRGQKEVTNDVSISPKGRLVVTASDDGNVRIYKCELCGSFEQLLKMARARLEGPAFARDGSRR